MKSRKKQFIEAAEKLLIERYTNKKSIECPICDVMGAVTDSEYCCCILDNGINNSCGNMETFILYSALKKHKARAEFWKRAIPKLKEIPTKDFAVSTFNRKAFDFLWDIDKEVAKEFYTNALL